MKLKRIAAIAAVTLGLMVGFSACKDDTSIPGPAIKITKGDKFYSSDEAILPPFNIIVNVDKETSIKSVQWQFVYKDGDTQNKTELKTFTLHKVEGTEGQEVHIPFKDGQLPTNEGTLIITATDKNGGIGIREQKIGGGDTPAPNPDDEKPKGDMGKVKEGVIHHANGTGNFAFDLKNGKKLSRDDSTPAERYIMHNSPENNSAFALSFTSDKVTGLVEKGEDPKNASAKKAAGNLTKFARLQSLNFSAEELTAAKCKEEFDKGQGTTTVTDVKEGNIYVAVKDNEIYVIKIGKCSTKGNSTRGGEGFIEFTYRAGTIK